MTILNRQWIYQQPPVDVVGPDHYRYQEQPLDTALGRDELLVEARYISVDPYMRIGQSGKPTYDPLPHPVGVVQQAGVVAQVLASNAAAFEPGDWVRTYSGWQTHAVLYASAVNKIDAQLAPVSTALGVLGMPGRTAWFGLTEAGKPRAGEVVVVSGAAGAVGSLVVQFAKKHGARVLAIAGGAEKCRWLREQLGADWTLDYREYHDHAALAAQIRHLTGGVDVYFDNVGGMVTDAVLCEIKRRARIVICGQISQYNGNLDAPTLGPRFLHHVLYQRATIQGILARDYLHRMDEMLAIVGPWVQRGEIIFEQHVLRGFAQLPQALNALFTGEHRGKLLVEV